MTGAITRAWVSARRSPVAQASYPASDSCSGRTLRSAQHRSGSRANRPLPYAASCSATVCSGAIVEQAHGEGRLHGVTGADRLGEVVAGVEEDHVDAGGDPAGEVGQHGVAHGGGDREPGAEGGDRPLHDVLGGGQLELGADVRDQVAQLGRCAALGVAAPERGPPSGGGGGHDVTSQIRLGRRRNNIIPVICSVNARRQAQHSQAPCGQLPGTGAVLGRTEVLVAAVGAVEGHPAALIGPPPRPRRLAAQRRLVGPGDPGRELLALVRSAR